MNSAEAIEKLEKMLIRHCGARGLQPARASCGGVETDRAVLGDVDNQKRNRLREDLPCT